MNRFTQICKSFSSSIKNAKKFNISVRINNTFYDFLKAKKIPQKLFFRPSSTLSTSTERSGVFSVHKFPERFSINYIITLMDVPIVSVTYGRLAFLLSIK